MFKFLTYEKETTKYLDMGSGFGYVVVKWEAQRIHRQRRIHLHACACVCVCVNMLIDWGVIVVRLFLSLFMCLRCAFLYKKKTYTHAHTYICTY